MPIYEYRCENGHQFEVMQRMTDDAVASCTTCDAPVQRVFHPVAVHFKGKGFYNTDYGTKRRNREAEASGRDGGSDTGADKSKEKTAKDAKPSSEPAKKAESKPAAKSSD
jgi:putative FmdB family regulatory protein